jgi:anaerobic selenocysteine-containing dehydrogenase/Fe-S-cluster-containing dehydrogenase component
MSLLGKPGDKGGDHINRRRFLTVLGAAGGGSLALTACGNSAPPEKLIPYLIAVDDQVPGVATWYATTCRECSAGCGVHARVREGRAVKLEGNPDNPINQGRLCARGQAALQGLYNPDRVRGPMARNASGAFEPIKWEDAVLRIGERLGQAGPHEVAFITGNESGAFSRLVDEWMNTLGAGARLSYEPFGYEALRHATREVFGTDELPWYDFAAAQFIISFGADFLETWMSPLESARGFTASHAYANASMGKFVHVEPRLSMTGMNADEWIAPTPGTEGVLALAMAHVIVRDRLGRAAAEGQRLLPLLQAYAPASAAQRCGVPAETIERLAHEFAAGPSVAVAGGMGAQHGDAHASAAAVLVLNYAAGNVGRTVVFGAEPRAGAVGSYQDLATLTQAMQDGKLAVLFLHGANPAYATPAGLNLAAAMRKVPLKVSFSRFLDETTMEADLVLPDHDPLEQWNEYEPRSGVYLLQQPVMQPVFDTRQTGDVLLDLAKRLGGRMAQHFSATTYKDYVQDDWRQVQKQVANRDSFDAFWTGSLERGGVWGDFRRRGASLAPSAMHLSVSPPSVPQGGFTLIVYPSSVLYDGRGANRPWLQELPDPVTKLTWDTWLEIHPDTAARLGIADGDMVLVRGEQAEVRAVAYLYPGIRADVVAMPLGQGHTAFGRYAQGRGANPYQLLPAAATSFGGVNYYAGVTVHLEDTQHEKLPTRAGNKRQLGRGIAQAVTLATMTKQGFTPEAERRAAPIPERIEEALDQWQEEQYDDWRKRGNYAGDHPNWGMVIDLSRCTGCSACVTACYAENNLAVVGKDRVQHGREMSWMRIERYFQGGEPGEGPLDVEIVPMLCQQCGNAPCEPVCPVFAAYHTPDGLNGQVYNRCVGTRYCSNNCPYKVRYFNWFDYQNPADPAFSWPAPLHWQLNPDVTVRSKGVMEKCTFCIQRIRGAQHEALLHNTPLKDGAVVTACQQSCPTEAIVFGDLNDPTSRVAALANDPRGYHVLEDLNTRPSITYLARVHNRAEA